jgi:hypothetical protein
VGTCLEGPYRVGARQWDRLAHLAASSPAWVAALGLGDPRLRPTYRTSAAEIAEHCISSCSSPRCATAQSVLGKLDAATIDAASALLDDPNYWTQCWMMTAVWVHTPLPDLPFAAASK